MQLIRTLVLAVFVLSIACIASAEQIPYSFMTAVQVVDVRSTQSRARSGKEVPGEIWIDPYKRKPLTEFINTQDKDKAYMIYCSCPDDGYSIRAAQILIDNGFAHVKVLKDAANLILENRLPMEKIKGADQK